MRHALEDLFLAEGFRVTSAPNGADALQSMESNPPDLVVLDVMMPTMDGFETTRRLRRGGDSIPVLLLTAKATVDDRVTGLNIGADDYLTKPFHSAELLARVRALLRRRGISQDRSALPSLTLGSVIVDFDARRASRGPQEIRLTSKEFGVLQLLAASPDQAISRELFLDRVWGYDAFPTTRTVDTHIASLRAKIANAGGEAERIETVHGIGYRLRSTPA